MRVNTIAIVMFIGSLFTCSNVFGQQFDPKKAILGAWRVDIESAIALVDRETDPERKQGLQMMLGMSLSYMFEFREDGSMLKGGVEYPSKFVMETDEDGILWMVPVNNELPLGFNRIEFDGPDRITMSFEMEDRPSLGIPLIRVFPNGMLAEGEIDHDSEAAIQGWWTVDLDQIKSMPWINSIGNDKFRTSVLEEAESKSNELTIGFYHGFVYAYSDEYSETQIFGEYSIRASDDRIVALSFLIDRGPDSESPLLRIDLHDEDRIDLLMTYLAPGPLPMIRRNDVELPSR